MTSECIRKAGDRIYSLKVSPYSNHLVVIDDNFQGSLYSGSQKKVEEIGDAFDFTEESLFSID